MGRLKLENRTGKVISLGRLTLSIFILTAVYHGTEGPPEFPRLSFMLCGAYVGLALLFLALTWSNWWLEHKLKLASHIVDIAFFLSLDVSTGLNVSSPFFPFFVFLVLSAAAKWGWRAAMATGVIVALLFAVEAASEMAMRTMAPDEYGRAIVRGGHLLVLSLMIAWFGLTRLSGERNLGMMFSAKGSIDPPVRHALAHMSECFGAGTAGLVWWERDEPEFNLARWTRDDSYSVERIGPADLDWVVDGRLELQTFLFDSRKQRALVPIDQRLRAFSPIVPLHPLLAERMGLETGLVTPLKSQDMSGYFIVGDIPGLCWDDLSVARRVAIDIARGFDRSALLRSSIDSTATRTRLGVARDLHDSIAQILAGIGLKLRAARTRKNAAERDAELQAIEAELVDYQRDIHALIEDLRQPAGDALRVDLEAALASLSIWLQRHWDVDVTFTGDHLEAVSRGLEAEISHLVQEATANAVRHGGASRIELSAEIDGDELVLRCADNGKGFAEQGRFGDAELRRQSFRPRSVLERVHGLGGTVELASGAEGSQLTMRMPKGTVEP